MKKAKNGAAPPEASSAAPQLAPQRLSLLWATQAHVGDIARLHSGMFENGWKDIDIAALLAHPGSVALVASQGGSSIVGGFGLAQVAADEAEILTLGVADGWRRHGVGERLVDGLKRAAARAGARKLFLEVADDNAAARALYAKMGFIELSRRKAYYQRTGRPAVDAIVLSTTLEPPA